MKAVTPIFRAAYPNLFKPRLNELSGKEEYSVVALFKKGEDLSALKKAAHAACVKKWGADAKKWPKNMKNPFRDQGEREKEDEATGKTIMPAGHEKGAIFMNLKSKNPPQVVDQKVQPILDDAEIYGGVYARASINFYAYSQAGNNGVAAGLNNVQKMRDGDHLGGGRTRAADDFETVDMPAGENPETGSDTDSMFS